MTGVSNRQENRQMTNFEQSMRMSWPVMAGQTEQGPKRTTWAITADTIDALDVADPDRTGDLETVDVGPFAGEYVRLVSSDLVLVADALRRLADRIIDATVDSREEFAALECPYCPTVLDPGVLVCGAEACQRELQLDRRAEGQAAAAASQRGGWA